MTPDPFENLIRAADASEASPPPADLSERVRRRAARQQARARKMRHGIGAAVLLMAVLLSVWRGTTVRGPNAPTLDAQEIAQLRREADDFATRANALQRQLDRMRGDVARQELRDESVRFAATAREADLEQAAFDRAASIAVTEGDFLWEVRRDRHDAQAAYERAVRNFPDSQWAGVARERLEQLNMN